MAKNTFNTHSLNGSVLDPVAEAEFFDDYWEKQPLHVARSNENLFESLLSVETIEELLSTNELHFPAVQLSHAGQSISPEEYTDERNRIVSGRVLERYHSGSTIVLTHMHKLNSELMDLCRDVQRQFMMRCQTNVYLSPAGRQGFNPHFDTHNVFILQVSGSKTFNFYSGGSSFPTSADAYNSEIHQVGSQTESIVLHAGDTLYIPRGFTHDAVASESEPSLHITLGVYPILMHELVQEMVHICTASDVNMRKSIPQGLWMLAESTAPTVERLNSILLKHCNEDVVNLALSQLRDSVAVETSKNCRNLIQKTRQQAIQLQSVIQVNHECILQVEQTGSTLKLRTFGAVIEFSDPFVSPVKWLIGRTVCKLEDIPRISVDERAALVEKLSEYDVVSVLRGYHASQKHFDD